MARFLLPSKNIFNHFFSQHFQSSTHSTVIKRKNRLIPCEKIQVQNVGCCQFWKERILPGREVVKKQILAARKGTEGAEMCVVKTITKPGSRLICFCHSSVQKKSAHNLSYYNNITKVLHTSGVFYDVCFYWRVAIEFQAFSVVKDFFNMDIS